MADNTADTFNQDFGDYVREQEVQSAMDMMDSVAMPAKPSAPSTVSDVGQVPAPDTVDAPKKAKPQSGNLTKVSDAAMGTARDVSLGVITAPRSVARGAVKGLNGMIGFIDGAAQLLPTLSFLDEGGDYQLAPDIVSGNTFRERQGKRIQNKTGKTIDLEPALPVPDKPAVSTVTGNVIEGISQFMVGFKGVDKIAKVIGTGAKIVNNPVIKGALSDLLAFDQHEERLSNLVQSVPALQNPVTEYLSAKPDDGFAEGKFKQAIEGIIPGAAIDGFSRGVTLLKQGKVAAAEMVEAGGTVDDLLNLPFEERAGVGIGDDAFDFLGKADDDILTLKQQKKLDVAEAEVTAAFGKPKAVTNKPNPTIDDYEINFSRIEGPDDIKRLMDDMVNKPELKPSIEAARRGKRTNAKTLRSSKNIDGFEELMSRRTGDAYNAETIVAARKVYYDTTDKLLEAAKRAASPLATDIDRFNFRKMVATHHAVQKEFMGVRAESGRALQAWSIPVGSGAKKARAVSDLLLEYGGNDASEYLAQKLVNRAGQLNTTQINKIVSGSAGARTLDAVVEAWTLGLLTNPTTHVINMGDTMLTGLWLGAERMVQSGLRNSATDIREGFAFLNGWMQSHKLALKNAADALRTGQVNIGMDKIDLPRVRATAKDVLDPDNKMGFISSAMDGYGYALQRYAGGLMAGGDAYNKTLMHQAQTYALATRDGLAKGLEGTALKAHVAEMLENMPPMMKADAAEFANYATYTKRLGDTGVKMQLLINSHPALRFVVPFARTPANIFKFTFERTPLGYLSKNIRDDIAAGGVRAATAKTRMAMGTAFMALGVDLTMNGHITGSGPVDPELRSALRRTGWQPNSIKIGDIYYSYSRFGYLGTALGAAADMAEILSNYESYDIDTQQTTDQLALAASMAFSNQIMGKTFMSGTADMVQVLSDPGRYGEGYAQRFASSFVPAGVAGIERAISPESEQVFNMIDAMKARIPGMSASVPKRRNIWGEEIATFYPDRDSILASTGERLLSLVNPVYYSKEKDAPIDRWLLKNGFEINMPQKRQTMDGVKIDLRDYPQAYDRLVALRGDGIQLMQYGGQTMKEFFGNLANETDPYGRHVGFFLDIGNDFEEQQNFINKVVRDYTDAAREQVLSEFPEIGVQIGKERKHSEELGRVRQSIAKMINGEGAQ